MGLVVPAKCNVGDTWYSMAQGQTLLEDTNQGHMLTWRFSKFSGKLIYDPVFSGFSDGGSREEPDEEVSEDHSNIASRFTRTPIVLAILLWR